MDNQYFTPEEFARKISVHPQSVRLWLREGNIKGVKLGRIWRIPESEAQKFLSQLTGLNEPAVAIR
jgi:acetyl-CoA synthetase